MEGDFDKMKEALERGGFVSLERGKDGNIKFGGIFDDGDDNDAALSYSAEDDLDLACLPKVIFVEKKNLHPSYQL